jgi:hypothetical protein
LVVGTLAVLAIAGITPAVAEAKAPKDPAKKSAAEPTTEGEGPSVAEEARIACLAGDWQKGVRLLAEVYVATKEPTWLYNQGRCYQQSNQGAMAITRFRDYLRVAPPESPLVAKAKTYIAEIEADMKKNEPATAPSPAPAPAPTIVVQPAPVQVTTAPAAVVTAPASAEPAPQRSFAARAATVSLLGVGAVGLGLGVFSSLKVAALQSDAEGGKVDAGQLEANASDASRYETLQWVGYGVGAAAVVGAGVVYGLSGRRGSDGAASASARADGGHLSAMWTRGSAGLLWEGTF